MDNLRELTAKVRNQGFKNCIEILVGKLLQSCSLQVSNHSDLVNDAPSSLHAFVKLLSPCVLHLLKEKLGNYLRRCGLKKITLFELANLQVKDRASLNINFMKTSRHELLDCFILQEVMFEYQIDLLGVTPLNPCLELRQGTGNVEVLRKQQARVHTVFENHFVDVVQNLLIIHLLHELM